MKVVSNMMLVGAALFIGSATAGTTSQPTASPSPQPTSTPTPQPTLRPTSGLRSAFTFHLPGNDNSVVKIKPAFKGVGVCNINTGSAYVCKKYDASGACLKKTMLPQQTLYVKNGNSHPDLVRIHQRVIQPAEIAWWNTNICVGGVGVYFTADCSEATKDTPNPQVYEFRGLVQCADGV